MKLHSVYNFHKKYSEYTGGNKNYTFGTSALRLANTTTNFFLEENGYIATKLL
jgi:hypothetical protein